MELIEVWKQMFRKIYRGEWCLLLVETSEDMKSRENIFKNEKIKKKLQKLFNTLKMEFMIQLGEYNIKHEESVSYLQR